MRMLPSFAAVYILLAPVVAIAQQPARSDSMPHGGQWGAEAVVAPSTAGVSVVRFHSPTFAWLLGAGFSTNRSTTKEDDIEGSGNTTTLVSASARLGMRWYRQSGAAKLRPVVGLGALGQFVRQKFGSPAATSRMGGGYGELGAVYFFAPHVSLGGTIELDATYMRFTRATTFGTLAPMTTTTVAASLPRIMLSVYF